MSPGLLISGFGLQDQRDMFSLLGESVLLKIPVRSRRVQTCLTDIINEEKMSGSSKKIVTLGILTGQILS